MDHHANSREAMSAPFDNAQRIGICHLIYQRLLIELGDFGYFGPAFMLVGEKFLGLLRPDILN